MIETKLAKDMHNSRLESSMNSYVSSPYKSMHNTYYYSVYSPYHSAYAYENDRAHLS